MTSRVQAAMQAADAAAEMTDEPIAMIERHNFRARFWRLAIGGIGLFWVCALLLLMR